MKKVTYYEALDGEKFETKEECLKHEKGNFRMGKIDTTIYFQIDMEMPYTLELPMTVINGEDDLTFDDIDKIENMLKCKYSGYQASVICIEDANGDMLFERGY